MSLNIIADARRELRALVMLAQCHRLDPSTFEILTKRLGERLDDVEAYLDTAGPVDQVALVSHRLAGVPVARMRIVGHLGVIDGGASA